MSSKTYLNEVVPSVAKMEYTNIIHVALQIGSMLLIAVLWFTQTEPVWDKMAFFTVLPGLALTAYLALSSSIIESPEFVSKASSFPAFLLLACPCLPPSATPRLSFPSLLPLSLLFL